MLKNGRCFLDGLDDGRAIRLGAELVRNPARHPAFRATANRMAEIYERRADPSMEGILWITDGNDPRSLFYVRPQNIAALRQRTAAHLWVARSSFGMLGRSFDHVASFVTGLAMDKSPFANQEQSEFDKNFSAFYERAARDDLNLCYAVLPAARSRDLDRDGDGLSIIEERDDGLIVTGRKRLATGAVFSDAVWIGNLQTLAQERDDEALTAVLPMATPGLVLIVRKPCAPPKALAIDYPLGTSLDESDAVLSFNRVLVPWSSVFVLRDTRRSREVYLTSPSHILGNHQACVRFWCKLSFCLGLAWRMATTGRLTEVPDVRNKLGELAGFEAMAEAMVVAHAASAETFNDYAMYNRRAVYATLDWASDTYPKVIATLRDLSGAGPLALPSAPPEVPDELESYGLQRLIWDTIGSDYGGRQIHYERFFAGPPYVLRSHSFRVADWESFAAYATSAIPGEARSNKAIVTKPKK